MALKKEEKMLVEAIASMLHQDARLGVPMHNETSHTSQFRWEGIDDTFSLKVAESPFADSITSAFFAVHSHKYIDNPSFKLSFEKEMTARAIPTEERTQAMKYLDEIVEDLSKNKPSESDAGWNPNMEEIVDITSNADNRKPKTSMPFTGGGPAPEGDRGGKGGLYMESRFEDTVNINTPNGIWKVTYKAVIGESPKITPVKAINEATHESTEDVYKLGITDDDIWAAITEGLNP